MVKQSLKSIMSLFLIMTVAFIFTACGSSDDAAPAKKVSYNGPATAAVITAENAKTLSTQAMGVGFLGDAEEKEAETETLTKVSSILVGGNANDEAAFAKAMTTLFKPQGTKAAISQSALAYMVADFLTDTDFPNISGEDSFTYELTLTIDETTGIATVSGTVSFTDSEHCVDSGKEVYAACQDKLSIDGTGSFSFVFHLAGYLEQLEEDAESYPSLAELQEMDTIDAFKELINFQQVNYYSAADGSLNPGNLPYSADFNLDGTIIAERAFFGNMSDEITNYGSVDGNFIISADGLIELSETVSHTNFVAAFDEETPVDGDGGYLMYDDTYTNTSSTVVTGKITLDYTSDYTEYDEEMMSSKSNVTNMVNGLMDQFSYMLAQVHYDRTINNKPVFEHADINASIEGTFNYVTSETSTKDSSADSDAFTSGVTGSSSIIATGTVDIDASLTGGATGEDVNLSVTVMDGNLQYVTEYENAIDNTTGFDEDLHIDRENAAVPDVKFTYDTPKAENVRFTISGKAGIDYTTTVTIVSPVSQTLTMDLEGSVDFNRTATYKRVTDTTDTTPENHIDSVVETETYDVTASGKLNITQGDNYFMLSGDRINVNISMNGDEDLTVEDSDLEDTTVTTEVDNFLIATNGLDFGVSGAATLQIGYRLGEDGTTKVHDTSCTVINIDSLVFTNFGTSKSFMFEDYKIELVQVAASEEAEPVYPAQYAHSEASVTGRFYNSDFGYVDVAATGDDVFKFGFRSSGPSKGVSADIIEDLFEDLDDMMIANIYPSFGALTVTGAGSSATLSALNASEGPDMPETDGFSITFGDTTTNYEWPDMADMYKNVIESNWLFIACTQIADNYIYLFNY